MTTATMITRHVLPGLRPEPLASYLAGLGLIRVLGEQADPAATAAWTPDGLVIGTTGLAPSERRSPNTWNLRRDERKNGKAIDCE